MAQWTIKKPAVKAGDNPFLVICQKTARLEEALPGRPVFWQTTKKQEGMEASLPLLASL